VPDQKIKTWIPVAFIFLSCFFLSDFHLFKDFGSRLPVLQNNTKLLWALLTGEIGQAGLCFGIAVVTFSAWRANRNKSLWYADIYWQMSGAFLSWALLAFIRVLGTFWMLLWIQAFFNICVVLFLAFFFNTMYKVRRLLENPPTNEEILKKNERFDEILKLLKDRKNG
jgi:DNA integrity scanning protein DisA with diadenylate cyclase activity